MWLLTKGACHILSIDTDLSLLSPSMSRKYGMILIINQTSTSIINLAEICQQIDRVRAGLSAREQNLEDLIFLGNYTKSHVKRKISSKLGVQKLQWILPMKS